MWRTFHRILFVPQNIVLDLNDDLTADVPLNRRWGLEILVSSSVQLETASRYPSNIPYYAWESPKEEGSKGHFTHETESLWPVHFKHSHWWKRWSRSKFASYYAWGTNGVSKWMQDGCIVYMASNGSCFTATWTIFKNHLLEVRLTQNKETMALRTLTTIHLFCFIMCENPHD